MPDENQNLPPYPPESPANEPGRSLPRVSQPGEQFAQPQPALQPEKSPRKKWIIGGIIAAVIVVLLGGGALAYTMYQSPQKVLADSIINLTHIGNTMSGTGSVEAANDDITVTITADAKSDGAIMNGSAKLSVQFKAEEQKSLGTISTSVDYATSKDGLWLKLNDISDVADKLVDAYIDNLTRQYAEMGLDVPADEIEQQKSLILDQIQPVLDKINNRWIKFDTDDADKQLDDDNQCVMDAIQAATSDKTQRQELTDVYNANQFIIVKEKLGTKDGNFGYRLNFDQAKAASFSEAVKDTTLGKALLECNPDTFKDDPIAEGSDDINSGDVEVWIGQWDHKLKRVIVNTEIKGEKPTSVKTELTLDYNKVTGLSTPKDATTVDELQSELQSLMMGGSSVLEI